MKELQIARKKVTTPRGSEILVDYCILSENLSREDGEFVCEGFGVKLSTDAGEQATVRTLTTSLKKINVLIDVLQANTVLPIELDAVLENLLALH